MTNGVELDSIEPMETTQASLDYLTWENPMGETRKDALKLEFHGAKVVKHSRYVIFQMAEVMVSKSLFHEILERIGHLKPVPIGSG